MHSGVNAGSEYVHTITRTAANVHDMTKWPNFIREDDEFVYGDPGYSGAEKQEEIRNARHLSIIEFRTNKCPKNIKVPDTYKGINRDKQQGNRKASTRCKVEHPFLIVKSSSVMPGLYDKV